MTSTIVPRGANTMPGEVPIFQNAGAPTNGTSGTWNGVAEAGALLVDVTNFNIYLNTNTQGSPTWTQANGVVNGTQVDAPSGNAATVTATRLLQTVAAGSFTSAGVISLPAAASNPGLKLQVLVAASATKTYSFSTNSSTGVAKWVGGAAPTYSTTAVLDYYEIISNGTNWIGVVASIGCN